MARSETIADTITLPASPRFLTLLVLLASATVVGGAWLFELVGGLAPCELCLYQRWPYYAAIAVAALALLSGNDGARRWANPGCCSRRPAAAAVSGWPSAAR